MTTMRLQRTRRPCPATATLRELTFLTLLVGVMLTGCAESAHQSGRAELDRVIPAQLRSQVDADATFLNVITTPEAYVGRTVMFSGIALKAKRAADHTEIEVLQLPTDRGEIPQGERRRSQGRFLAQQEDFLDPATIEPGTPLTVVGDLKPPVTRPLDESQYTYPVVAIKHLVDWSKSYEADYAGAYAPAYAPWGGYYRPYPYLWGGPYGYGAYPYAWGPYFPLLFGAPGPAPGPTPGAPPGSLPPQFRRRN